MINWPRYEVELSYSLIGIRSVERIDGIQEQEGNLKCGVSIDEEKKLLANGRAIIGSRCWELWYHPTHDSRIGRARGARG